MKAKSIQGKSTEEIIAALQQSMEDGFRPTLAIVFISVKQNRTAICKLLVNNDIDILGATSCGEFINGHQDEGSTVILLLDLHRNAYDILFENIGTDSIQTASALIAKKAKEKFEKPALIVCSTGLTDTGEFFDGEILVKSLESALGADITFLEGWPAMTWHLHLHTFSPETKKAIMALLRSCWTEVKLKCRVWP
jgi:hypothetical protein